MSLAVKRETDSFVTWGETENCCMCGEKTIYWFGNGLLALCPDCARVTKEEELPTREEWFAKERLLHKSIWD